MTLSRKSNWANWLILLAMTIIAIVLVSSCVVSPKSPQLTPTATLDLGITCVSEADGMVQVYVPAGEFLMGNTDDAPIRSVLGAEMPQHTAYLDAFWIDQTEITNAMYARCVAAKACQPPLPTKVDMHYSFYGDSHYDNYPMGYVSWYDAKNYCEWVGRQLPSEAQWEKAAHGTDGRLYPWGNEPVAGSLLNFCDVNCIGDWRNSSVDDGYAFTAPVGSYPAGASPYGVLDMAGNVAEWVEDWYHEYPSATCKIDTLYTKYKVTRGGSCLQSEISVASALRGALPPEYSAFYLGFRCAE